jgi:hypothetical protein
VVLENEDEDSNSIINSVGDNNHNSFGDNNHNSVGDNNHNSASAPLGSASITPNTNTNITTINSSKNNTSAAALAFNRSINPNSTFPSASASASHPYSASSSLVSSGPGILALDSSNSSNNSSSGGGRSGSSSMSRSMIGGPTMRKAVSNTISSEVRTCDALRFRCVFDAFLMRFDAFHYVYVSWPFLLHCIASLCIALHIILHFHRVPVAADSK